MRIFLFMVWIAFIGYAFIFAPGERGMDDVILSNLFSFQAVDPSILAVFSLLGVFPAAFGCMLLRADRFSTPAWPFVLGSFFLGAFALLPYFIFVSSLPRRNNRTPAWLFALITNRLFLFLLFILAMFLIYYGLFTGNWHIYLQAFTQSHLVHVMTIDLVVLCFLSMIVIYRDRTYLYPWKFIPVIGLLPAIGLLTYNLLFAADAHRG